jgi:hypothetical protein
VLQLGEALQGKRNALFREFDHLGVGVASGGPTLYIGGLGPPDIDFVVVDDAHGLH